MTWFKTSARKWRIVDQNDKPLGTFEGDTPEDALEFYLIETSPEYSTIDQWSSATGLIHETHGNKITIRPEENEESLERREEELQRLILIVAKIIGKNYYKFPDGGKQAMQDIEDYRLQMPHDSVADVEAITVKIWNYVTDVLGLSRDELVRIMEDRRRK